MSSTGIQIKNNVNNKFTIGSDKKIIQLSLPLSNLWNHEVDCTCQQNKNGHLMFCCLSLEKENTSQFLTCLKI